MSETSRKLRILCLHGYRQNGEMFRVKTGSLRKALKKEAEFVFMDAPHLANIPADEVKDNIEARGWWFSRPELHFKATDSCDTDVGFDRSVAVVLEKLNEPGEPKIDGLLGFSQGACLAALLMGMHHRKEIELNISFAILFSGFVSGCATHCWQVNTQINTPSLHIYGNQDAIISTEMSERLCQMFTDKEVIVHEGGHFIPSINKFKPTVIPFLQRFMTR